ncbi:MAG: DNA polymerase I [Mycobacteriales bacterium]
MTSPAVPRLLLLDGHSLAYRAYFALPVENFSTTTTGQATNAVYGFTSMLINVVRDEQPTHIAVAFDVSRASFRTEQYAEYKAGRAATPDEFRGQIDLIREVLVALGIATIAIEGYEADDIIATLATQAGAAGIPALICSGDRDAFQLVGESCTVLYPRKGVSDLARITPAEVLQRYGVDPEHHRDLAALVGESADNLPGVPGVGPKTAAKWLATYGSLSALVEHVDEITGKAGDALREHLAGVLRNYELNRLITDMTLPYTVDQLRWTGIDRQAMHQLFDTLQFRVLRERLQAAWATQPEMCPTDPADGGADSAGASAAPMKVVNTLVGPGELAPWFGQHSPVGSQVGLAVNQTVDGRLDLGAGLAVGTQTGEAAWLAPERLDQADSQVLAQWLADAGVGKVCHNAKPVITACAAYGWQLQGLVSDTAVQAYVVRPDQRSYDLADLVVRYLHVELPDDPAVGGQLSLDGLDSGVDSDALATRAVAVARLSAVLAGEVAQVGAAALVTDVELPLVALLAQLEQAGIAANAGYLEQLRSQFAADVNLAAQLAHQVVGREFNLGSPKQLQAILFDELGLPKTKRIKTGYTTDADALAWLYAQTDNPLLAHLLRHRDVMRLKTTVDGLLKTVADDGRIHTTFNQLGTATGRLSSVDPNLQNIPVRTDEGRQIRRAFVVGRGYESLMTADYSQIEMRIMAHLSDDAGLIDAFHAGEDLHTTVAARVFNVAPSAVDPELRRRIKAMSYGLAYGLSVFGLAQQLGISSTEAQALREEYFLRFGGIRDYLHGVVEQARRDGYTSTILGRRRYLPDLVSDNRQRREMAERMALNAPIQGSAADVMKVAMLSIATALRAEGLASRLLLQVHDELIFEIAPGESEQVEKLAREHMADAVTLKVPLEVSVGVGADWDTAAH